MALAPDGRHLVYVGQAGEGTQLFLQDLQRFDDPVPIPGSEAAQNAFFSPDSSHLGFFTEDRIKTVDLNGGEPTTVCRARTPVFGKWIGDTIYFSEEQGRVLAKVPSSGGEPTRILVLAHGRFSDVLPGESAALARVRSPLSTNSDYSEIRVLSFDGQTDRSLPIRGFDARWVPSGHLVFGFSGRLQAVPFDLDRLEVRGEPVAALSELAVDSIFGHVHLAFSANGTGAFVPGGDLSSGKLAWIDRRGEGGFLNVPERVYGAFDIAPDDERFALQVADVRDYVWLWSSRAGGRVLASPGLAGWPVWSPDSEALAYQARPDATTRTLVTQVLESGAIVKVQEGDAGFPYSWQASSIGFSLPSHDGAGIVRATEAGSIVWLEKASATNPRIVMMPTLSPGAEWVAYVSDEGTGRLEIWLEALEGEAKRRVQVSTNGGVEPSWCRSCGELFFRQGNRIWASRVQRESLTDSGRPRLTFEAVDFTDTDGVSFRVSSDGERLYYIRRSKPPARDRIHLIQNWFEELERLVPTH